MQRGYGLIAALVACTTLANCEAGDVAVLRDRGVTEDNLALANAAAASPTPLASLPAGGSASYDGVVAASVSGDYVGSLYADLAMNIDFASGSITGQVTNADLVDDDTGEVVQNLDGTLTVTGGQAGGVVSAVATGVLVATSSGPVSGSGTANLGLLGDIRTDTSSADTVYGTATGSVTGDLDLGLSDGEFYGTTN